MIVAGCVLLMHYNCAVCSW